MKTPNNYSCIRCIFSINGKFNSKSLPGFVSANTTTAHTKTVLNIPINGNQKSVNEKTSKGLEKDLTAG